ncbi:MAG: hypothetical protein ABGZ17_21430, partial [Planctomycetaceae bacterium]
MKRLMLLLVLGVVGCGQPAVTESEAEGNRDSHQRMLAALREVQARTADEHPYLGDRLRRQYARQLSDLPVNAPPSMKVKMHWRLADAQLKSGQTQQAVEQFLECSRLLREAESVSPNAGQVQDHLAMRLSVAYLRLAEDQNCVNCRDEDCCIFPIRAGGVHRNKESARNAIKHLTEYLERNSADATATWLLNVAYMTLGEYPHGVPKAWLVPED